MRNIDYMRVVHEVLSKALYLKLLQCLQDEENFLITPCGSKKPPYDIISEEGT